MLNWALLRNPYNWVTVLAMVTIAAFVFTLLFDEFGSTAGDNAP